MNCLLHGTTLIVATYRGKTKVSKTTERYGFTRIRVVSPAFVLIAPPVASHSSAFSTLLNIRSEQ